METICKYCGYDEGLNPDTGECPSCGAKVVQEKPKKKKGK